MSMISLKQGQIRRKLLIVNMVEQWLLTVAALVVSVSLGLLEHTVKQVINLQIFINRHITTTY